MTISAIQKDALILMGNARRVDVVFAAARSPLDHHASGQHAERSKQQAAQNLIPQRFFLVHLTISSDGPQRLVRLR
jgi:hypothetical protein